ncbi:MAG: leucine-rich repeat protein [Kiritimatiellia bacterium]
MQVASKIILWNDTFSGKGTVLAVEPSVGNMTVTICSGTLAEGSDSVTIDWGDGTKESRAGISMARHTYTRAREYRITISDDLKSFGFSDSSQSVRQRDVLRELLCLGSKITSISGYAFNNCHNMRGVMNLPNVTNIGGYAFGTTLGITDFILPSLQRVVQTSFYAGPSPTQIHIDNATQIDSRFWEYYGGHLTDMYIRGKTRQQIRAMSGFPFYARGTGVRFHGSDGIVLADGTFV